MVGRGEWQDDQMGALELLTNRAEPDLPFKLMVRPFTTVGVETRYPFTLFEDELPSLIAPNAFSSLVRRVVVTPTIIDPTLAVPPKNYTKFNRRGCSIFVGNIIDYQTWNSSLPARKLELFANNIIESIKTITPKYLSQSDSQNLILAIGRILRDTKVKLLS